MLAGEPGDDRVKLRHCPKQPLAPVGPMNDSPRPLRPALVVEVRRDGWHVARTWLMEQTSRAIEGGARPSRRADSLGCSEEHEMKPTAQTCSAGEGYTQLPEPAPQRRCAGIPLITYRQGVHSKGHRLFCTFCMFYCILCVSSLCGGVGLLSVTCPWGGRFKFARVSDTSLLSVENCQVYR